ncbi:MAG: hypothetical protein IRY89_15525 [Pseudolabrys sp.]|nr:hypothetical protein [Pseudolabrys sp.]
MAGGFRKRSLIAACAIACATSPALAQGVAYEGRHGIGHERWHREFYSRLMRPGTQTSCCNLIDCVPTQSRMAGDHYEVMVDGEWTRVPPNTILNVAAPDGGAHVCFSREQRTIFCVVLPPET